MLTADRAILLSRRPSNEEPEVAWSVVALRVSVLVPSGTRTVLAVPGSAKKVLNTIAALPRHRTRRGLARVSETEAGGIASGAVGLGVSDPAVSDKALRRRCGDAGSGMLREGARPSGSSCLEPEIPECCELLVRVRWGPCGSAGAAYRRAVQSLRDTLIMVLALAANLTDNRPDGCMSGILPTVGRRPE